VYRRGPERCKPMAVSWLLGFRATLYSQCQMHSRSVSKAAAGTKARRKAESGGSRHWADLGAHLQTGFQAITGLPV